MKPNTLILLPGWSFAPTALLPLAQAIEHLAPAFEVRVEPLPQLTCVQPADWLNELNQRLPMNVWLGGWSLGGMLASALAAQRGEACQGVLTFASNACFVASPEWPCAMPSEVFSAFYQGCQENTVAALKRFDMLCAQGCVEPRQTARLLAQHHTVETDAQRLAGLQVLAHLDNRAALQAFEGPQGHALAGQDAFLPESLVQALPLSLNARGNVCRLESTGHAALLEQPAVLAAYFASVLQGAFHVQ